MNGTMPAGNGDLPSSVEASREVVKQDDAFHIFGLLMMVASIPVVIWLTWPTWDTRYWAYNVMFIGMISFAVAVIGFGLREYRIGWRSNRVVLGVDGVRLYEDDRLLKRIKFDKDTLVDVHCEGGPSKGTADDVLDYYFRRGLRVVRIDRLFRHYSREDFARMWPVVRAAVRKHRMRLGEDIVGMLKEDG